MLSHYRSSARFIRPSNLRQYRGNASEKMRRRMNEEGWNKSVNGSWNRSGNVKERGSVSSSKKKSSS